MNMYRHIQAGERAKRKQRRRFISKQMETKRSSRELVRSTALQKFAWQVGKKNQNGKWLKAIVELIAE